ncbi:MAG: AAA family ATPase [Flavobacteriaceae bacterium]|nr:AAA family ATPase [Flavobacteriaceae bacterium]
MDDHTINSLKAALQQSPENNPLRLLLAQNLLLLNRLEEAEKEFAIVAASSTDFRAKLGLAKVYFAKGNYSACNVILEEIIASNVKDIDVYILYTKALLEESSIEKAIDAYREVLAIDPKYKNDEIDSQLRHRYESDPEETITEEEDYRFLQKPDINFSDVGGMEGVKKEIEMKIIQPLLQPELYKAYGKKTGGGILLYGPPGCGKTFIAKATAGQVQAKFISVSLNDILDMWVGSSEKNLHELFEVARNNSPCVLFIDEIDALGASRSDMKQSSSRPLINQFLQELDGIEHSNEGLLIIGATNTPWNLDPAFRRPGRFDRILFVPPPDQTSKEAILRIKLKNKPTKDIDIYSIAKKCKSYSGADIDAIIDIAIEQKLEASFKDGIPKPLETKDLLKALKKHHPSTQEWFTTAKNFAMFANDSGLYDEILDYLKKNK